MKKFVLATLAVLGVVLGTVSLTAPANANQVHLYAPSEGNGQG